MAAAAARCDKFNAASRLLRLTGRRRTVLDGGLVKMQR